MDGSKPWYLSRTIIGILIMVLGDILRRAGVADLLDADIQEIADLVMMAIEGGGAGLAIWGRLAARKAIGNRAAPAALMLLMLGALAAGGPIGCASYTAAQHATPARVVYAIQADYVATLRVAAAYESLPRCGPADDAKMLSCSAPNVVAGLRSADNDAWVALEAAQKAVRDPAAAQSKLELAIAGAKAAVEVFAAVVRNHGLME